MREPNAVDLTRITLDGTRSRYANQLATTKSLQDSQYQVVGVVSGFDGDRCQVRINGGTLACTVATTGALRVGDRVSVFMGGDGANPLVSGLNA